MTPAEARELVAQALESGEYKQGVGSLCENGKYCCLGVATEVYMKYNPNILTIDVGRFKVYRTEPGTPHVIYLPHAVRKWLGFRTCNGDFNTNQALSKINDSGTPFTEIAKLFRNPPEGLLK